MNKTIWRGDLDYEIPFLWDNEIPEPLQLEVPGKTTMSWPKSLQEITTECGDGAGVSQGAALLGRSCREVNPCSPHPGNPPELCPTWSQAGKCHQGQGGLCQPHQVEGQGRRGRKITGECWPGSQRDIGSESGHNFAHKMKPLGLIAAAPLGPEWAESTAKG